MTQNILSIRTAFRDKVLTVSGWTEATIPYELFAVDAAPDQPAAPVTHKTFCIGLRQVVDRHETRSQGGGIALMRADVTVRLVHRIVPADRMAACDTAWTDAQAVFVALMQQSATWPADILIAFDGLNRSASLSGEWMVTDLNYAAQWSMTLS